MQRSLSVNLNVKNTVKSLLIILSILSANVTLAVKDDISLHTDMLHNIIDPPNTAALNIMAGILSSLKELKKQNQATPENIKALINIKLLPNIAMDVVMHLALKNHWDELNYKQKQLFQYYITHSLIKDYEGVLGTYEKLNSVNISVNPKVRRKDNKAIVKLSIAFDSTQNPFNVTLKMVRSDRWRVYDMLFSGVSLIKNYQAQFNSHIKRKGIDSLVKKIRRKLAKN